MSAISSIEWTDRTWNPVRGCKPVSAGCTNCFAQRQAHRFSGPGKPYEGLTRMTSHGPVWTGTARLVPEALHEPLSWRKPARIFVNSMSDLFHESLSDEEIAAVFGIMAACPHHTFQILTKRPERAATWFRYISDRARAYDRNGEGNECRRRAWQEMEGGWADRVSEPDDNHWPLPNVWLGVSVENQTTADERIPLLLQTPAAVRFVSYEPALGPVDFTRVDGGSLGYKGITLDALHGGGTECDPPSRWRVDWLIVGGESGPRARPCDVAWIRSAVRQCRRAGVPVFVKQLGAYVVDRNDAGFDGGPGEWPDPLDVEDEDPQEFQGAAVRVRLRDRKGGDPAEWPEDLRIREFPR